MHSLLPPKSKDWTDPEGAEIERIRKICNEFSNLELECNRTDEGDPWCIVYDKSVDQILLHIARIDRRYVVVDPQKGVIRCTSMVAAVGTARKWLLKQGAHALAKAG